MSPVDSTTVRNGRPRRLQNVLGIGGELFELVVALLGPRELHQLHLLKLVLADDAAHVAAVGAGFAAEAGRVGAQRDGQLVGVESFVAKQIGDGDFGGGSEPEIVVSRILKRSSSNFGKLAGAEEAGGIDQEGRQHFGIAVLARMHVEHEIDQRAFQPRARCPNRRQNARR